MIEDIVTLLEDLGKDLGTDVIASYIFRNPDTEETISTKTVTLLSSGSPQTNSEQPSQAQKHVSDDTHVSEPHPRQGVVSAISSIFCDITDISLKMVFVVNMSLKMGRGKQCAQVGHATLALYNRIQESGDNRLVERLGRWASIGQKKIVVKAENLSEMFKVKRAAEEADLPFYLVSDAGCTQIAPGSRTVLGVFGNDRELQTITGHLKLL